jgi:hypothetical protein
MIFRAWTAFADFKLRSPAPGRRRSTPEATAKDSQSFLRSGHALGQRGLGIDQIWRSQFGIDRYGTIGVAASFGAASLSRQGLSKARTVGGDQLFATDFLG